MFDYYIFRMQRPSKNKIILKICRNTVCHRSTTEVLHALLETNSNSVLYPEYNFTAWTQATNTINVRNIKIRSIYM